MEKYVHLQGIGIWNAKSAKELHKGDTIIWNYGYCSTVLDIIPSATGKTVVTVLQSKESGKVSGRRLGADRLVAVK